MATNYTSPHDVHSPKEHWSLIVVLDDGNDEPGALAIGRWDGKLRLAMRWNGDEKNPKGNPSSRGYETWFILPPKYNEAILNSLPSDKLTLARSFFTAPKSE